MIAVQIVSADGTDASDALHGHDGLLVGSGGSSHLATRYRKSRSALGDFPKEPRIIVAAPSTPVRVICCRRAKQTETNLQKSATFWGFVARPRENGHFFAVPRTLLVRISVPTSLHGPTRDLESTTNLQSPSCPILVKFCSFHQATPALSTPSSRRAGMKTHRVEASTIAHGHSELMEIEPFILFTSRPSRELSSG